MNLTERPEEMIIQFNLRAIEKGYAVKVSINGKDWDIYEAKTVQAAIQKVDLSPFKSRGKDGWTE